MLKDDNLGLGARRNQGDECTGLDAFQDLLGRLNGKTEQALEVERRHRSDIKLSLYVERKYGAVRFVKGGLLSGSDRPEEEAGDRKMSGEREGAPAVPTPSETTVEEGRERTKREKGSKKRKAGDDENDALADSGAQRKEKRKRRKEKKSKSSAGDDPESTNSSEETDARERLEETKSKKGGKKPRGLESGEKNGEEQSGSERLSKKEKKKKRRKSPGAPSEVDGPAPDASGEVVSPASTPTGVSTPAGSGSSTPISISSRHFARKRFIAQKRMAVMDPHALNQVSFLDMETIKTNAS